MRAICIVSVYSTAKSTYLYSLAGNIPHIVVISYSAGVYPLPASGQPCQARPKTEARPAGLLGSLIR
jgi:hypothetical protein